MPSNPWAVRLLAVAAVTLAVAAAPGASAAAGAEPDPWSPATTATVGQDSGFKAVAAIAADDAWAVGATDLFDGATQQKTLAQHWDGARWSTVPTPNQSISNTLTNGSVLDAVAAISAPTCTVRPSSTGTAAPGASSRCRRSVTTPRTSS